MVAGDRVHFSYGVRVSNSLAISLKTISFRSLSILLTAAELTHVHADTNAFHQSEFFFLFKIHSHSMNGGYHPIMEPEVHRNVMVTMTHNFNKKHVINQQLV